MSDNVVRQRNCCVKCGSVSIAKRKKHSEWHCTKCDARFLVPVQREYEYKFTHLPPILRHIMENKKEEYNTHGKNKSISR